MFGKHFLFTWKPCQMKIEQLVFNLSVRHFKWKKVSFHCGAEGVFTDFNRDTLWIARSVFESWFLCTADIRFQPSWHWQSVRWLQWVHCTMHILYQCFIHICLGMKMFWNLADPVIMKIIWFQFSINWCSSG